MTRRVLTLIALLLFGGFVAHAQTGTADTSIVIPGTPATYWSAAQLTGTAPEGAPFLLQFIRAVEAMELNDPARLAALQASLNGSPRGRVAVTTTFAVPAPLRTTVWSRFVPQVGNAAAGPLAGIVGDRRLRRLLYGAAALDPETRAWLENQPATIERIVRNASDAFAPFGRSVRIRGNAVAVPGGAPAQELWEALTGEPASAPDRFVVRVLSADGGALAAFYDSVMHLDPARQRFALGLTIADRERRQSRFNALYAATREVRTRDPLARQPFARSGLDLMAVLSQIGVRDDGRMAPPAAARFWRSAFALTPRSQDAGADAPGEPLLDAAAIAETVLLATTTPWEQLAPILFAQRLHSRASGAWEPGQAQAALRVVHGFRRFPALLLALERTGLRDPVAYDAVLGRAMSLNAGGQPYRLRLLLAQFQGTMGLVEQLRRAGRVGVADAEALLATLARVEPNQDRLYAGGIARWIDEQLLPRLRSVNVPEVDRADAEAVVLAGLAGGPTEDSPARALEWEDWTYHVDPSTVPFAALRKIRKAQAGTSLQTVLETWRVLATLSAGGPDADRLQTVRRAIDRLSTLQPQIVEPRRPLDGTARDAVAVQRMLADALVSLRRITDVRQLNRMPDAAERLATIVDVLTADVVPSLVYAVHIRDADSPLLLDGDVAYRHDFGLLNQDALNPDLLAWWFPVEHPGAAWQVRGSLLGLDLGLARLRLPNVAAAGAPAPPVLTIEDRRVFLEYMALFAGVVADDAGMQKVARAVQAGRARVAAAVTNAQAWEALLADAAVSEWRRFYLLPWIRQENPQSAIEMLGLSELFWLGVAGATPSPDFDAWGASPFSLGGCLCLRMPPPRPWEDFSGRAGALPAYTAAPGLRLAELLTALELPAALARHVLPELMREFLDQVKMVHSEDWTAVERFWATVSRDRVEDIVAQLTVDGPLMAGDTR
jgi:hypothetical protein